PEGLIEYAACADGKRYFGKHFISGFHPAQTFERVFSPWNRPATLKRTRGIPNTLSCFMLHALVREQSLLYRRENLYIHLKDVWFDEEQTDKFPASFAVFFQEHPQQTGFASTFSVMCFMSYELCRQWEHTFHANGTNTRLDAAYQHFKTEYSQYILDSVLPYLKLETADIIKTEASTPLSFRDYLGSADGATYGMEKNAYRHAEMTLSTRTRIPNLFLTGQNINMHGVLGVCITSVLCAAELCGLDPLLEKINEAATG
ncbi:MAG TPA: hypothetical protein PLP34_04305, partial [Chitinophagaceae bacterium]|nr:hypothetical protein [Chitinophagaceae bacterium]